MGAGRLLEVSRPMTRLSISAYAIAGLGRTCIMLVNKEPSTEIDVEIMPGGRFNNAQIMTLSAPRLDSVTGITLNGAPVEADGDWFPGPPSAARMSDGSVIARVGSASAVLVVLT
jgi:hypothetical protein